jgi:DNA mismatch repair protein MutS
MSRNIQKKYVKKEGLKDLYFELTKNAIKEHGDRTILWLQVGSFYEMYIKYNRATKEYSGSNLLEIVELCNGEIGEKKEYGKDTDIMMWGFPDVSAEDYKDKIMKYGYTILIHDQKKEKNVVVSRELTETITPGMYISHYDNNVKETNNLSCVIIKPYNDVTTGTSKYAVGYSNINIFNGNSQLFEYRTQNLIIDPTTFDELERQMITNPPNELLMFCDIDNDKYNTLVKYLGINEIKISKLGLDCDYYKNSLLRRNVNHCLTEIFGDEVQNCSEFVDNQIATQSISILISYISKYNPLILKNINMPILNSSYDHVLLANHTLKQLNIIEDGINVNKKSKMSSVCNFLNNCMSSIGKRGFTDILLNPSTDIEYLQSEYDIIEHILNDYDIVLNARKFLKNVFNIELISRKMITKKAIPSDIFKLYETSLLLKELFSLSKNEKLIDYLKMNVCEDKLETICDDLCKYINKYLYIENCKISKINSESIKNENGLNIVKSGFNDKFDELINDYKEKIELFNEIKEEINKCMCNTYNSNLEYLKIHSKEKSGNIIQITKTRSKLLKDIINSKHDPIISFKLHNVNYELNMKEIKFDNSTSVNYELNCPLIIKTSNSIFNLKFKILEAINTVFIKIVEDINTNYGDSIKILSQLISKYDVLQCKVYNAYTYNYSKPVIKDNDKSYVKTIGLRHLLIEQIQQNECYVSNDISLGTDKNGMLLYGTNAVGKTSFIRALGISIICSQSGMYVPCEYMELKPYSAIYSRILGNDNLFKGLSTFAVEMSELRTILNSCNKDSIILGDELCSGTEQESALSICAAGIKWLLDKNSSFIFATHYHDLADYKEINQSDKMTINHMSVIYDEKSKCLVYERKLKEGSGSRTYGLEVLKSLHIPKDFIKMTYDIKDDLYSNNILINPKASKYNSLVIKPELCALCKKCPPTEVHHIEEQCKANNNNFIGEINKNHGGNLIWLCNKCHAEKQKEGCSLKIKKKVKTTNGMKVQTSEGII